MSRIDAQSLKRFWTDETPGGSVNGANLIFTLSQTPLENDAVDVFLDGLKQIITTDYTVSGLTITFITAPATGQLLRVDYIRSKGE